MACVFQESSLSIYKYSRGSPEGIWDQFIADIDANAVVNELLHKAIIPEGVQRNISKTDCPKQQNETLHVYLMRTCTNEAFKTACGIIASVQGNPRMSALGKDMQRRMESGMCVCVCVRACVCNLAFHCTPHGGSSRFGCLFMFTLWSHCYDNLLSSTCLSQPLHYAVEGVGGGGGGGGGGPSGGSGSEGEKEVGCSTRVVCVHVCSGVVHRCFYAKKAD